MHRRRQASPVHVAMKSRHYLALFSATLVAVAAGCESRQAEYEQFTANARRVFVGMDESAVRALFAGMAEAPAGRTDCGPPATAPSLVFEFAHGSRLLHRLETTVGIQPSATRLTICLDSRRQVTEASLVMFQY